MRSFTFNSNGQPLRRLVIKGLFLIVLLVLSYWTIFATLHKNRYSYLCGFEQKMALLRNSKSPRIIFTGGSNAAFGIDSKRISRTLNIGVVNTGLHGGLGLAFMLNATLPYVRTGDLVVIIPEYQFFCGHLWRGDSTLAELLIECPSAQKYLGWEHIPTVIQSLPPAIQKRFLSTLWALRNSVSATTPAIDRIYHANAFNAFGDVISHINVTPPKKVIPLLFGTRPSQYNFRVLGNLRCFVEHCRSRGADVCVLPPCIRRDDYDASSRVFTYIHERLKRQMPRHVVLSDPEEYALDGTTYFFDTRYHLNAAGRIIRTERLIEDLKRTGWYKMHEREGKRMPLNLNVCRHGTQLTK